MRNPGPRDLVYLSGGENREFEVAEYPTLGKRAVRMGQQVDIYDARRRQGLRPVMRGLMLETIEPAADAIESTIRIGDPRAIQPDVT